MIFGGDGLARLPQGFVIFVPFAAEGDRVRVRVTERKAQHARAEIVTSCSPARPAKIRPVPTMPSAAAASTSISPMPRNAG